MTEEREKLLRQLLAMQERYDLDVTRRALLAEAQRKEREEDAARAAGEQRAMEAAIKLECAYRSSRRALLPPCIEKLAAGRCSSKRLHSFFGARAPSPPPSPPTFFELALSAAGVWAGYIWRAWRWMT